MTRILSTGRIAAGWGVLEEHNAVDRSTSLPAAMETAMIVLGKTYSDRIDKLCAVLRELSGQSPSFDHEIKRDDVFGEPNGQYHGNSRPPRISLKPDVAEIVVAHEILHAILECARFPGWCDKLKSLFPFATAAAQEICHCVLHTVIDRALSNLSGVR